MAGGDRLKFFVDILAKIEGADRADAKLAKLHDRLNDMQRRSAASKSLTGGRFFETMGAGASKALPAVAAVAESLLSMGAVAGGAVIGLGLAGAKFALDAASFKRNTLTAFELMLGSKESAKATYERIKAIADETPFQTEDVMTTFKTLMSSGFDQTKSEQIFSALSDVASVQGKEGPEKLQEMLHALVRMQASGKLDARELMAFTSGGGAAGVGAKQITEAVAKMRGISVDAAHAMISSGAIKSDEGIQALLATVKQNVDKGAELGTATKKFGIGSLEGQISTLKSRFKSLFEDVNIEPVIGMLTRFNDALSATTPEGKKLRAVLNTLYGEVFSKLGAALTPERIVAFVAALAEFVQMGYALSKAFAGAAWDAFMQAMKPAMEVFSQGRSAGIDWIQVMTNLGIVTGYTAAALVLGIGAIAVIVGFCVENWKLLAVVVGGAILPLVAVLAPFIALGAATYYVIDGIMAMIAVFSDALQHGVNFGSALVDGITAGVRAAWGDLKGTWNALVNTLPDTVAQKLQIASPSRVMIRMGEHIVAGLAEGIEGAGLEPSLAMGAAAGAIPAMAGAAGGGGGGTTIQVNGPFYITVTGSGGMESMAADAANAFKEKLADVLQELQVQQGG